MSSTDFKKYKCGACGSDFYCRVLSSTNIFGSPDLDLRPAPMKRNTMSYWLKKCPMCGYIHTSIEDDAEIHKDFIKTDEYKTCEGNNFSKNLASDFYRFGMILLREERYKRAYDNFLCAAWVFDDANDAENSRICREKAVSIFNEHNFTDSTFVLKNVDVLRRSGHFKEAAEVCETFDFGDSKDMKAVAAFQLKLCGNHDCGCYKTTDCAEFYDI